MKILFLTQWFDPEPTPKGLLFAKKLKELGHEIEILTAIPNYPLGKYYEGYKFKFFQEEFNDDIRIIRAPIYPSHDNSIFRRFLTYITFSFSSLLIGIFATRKVDIIYAYHPPHVGFIAMIIGFFKRAPYVHDVQDIWPDTFLSSETIRNKRVLFLIRAFSNWVYRKASALIVISPGFKRSLMQRDIPEHRLHVVFNWCEESKLKNRDYSLVNPIEDNGKFNFVFAGNMGKAQDLIVFLEAAKVISQKNSTIQFNLIGDGIELGRLKEYVNLNNINNVSFIPRLSMDKVGTLLSSSDVLVVHLKPDPLFSITIPSKIQAYLSLGKPILSNVKGDASDIIKSSGAGIIFEPGSVKAFVEAIEGFYRMDKDRLLQMGKKGEEYYYKNMSLDIGVKSSVRIFSKIMAEQ